MKMDEGVLKDFDFSEDSGSDGDIAPIGQKEGARRNGSM